ncbi:acidic endochitinase-like [Coffea eugenioides]|uniref:acidic endochitinase-like n=1 Tax=Coffea eugenioides TaxID=49369 RepID=UPI000F60B89E|nr:acidic endochitinase-like [Coffea eugenioides]XP_027184542.1 acidic endochitinase-like [Coffea eugenioides]
MALSLQPLFLAITFLLMASLIGSSEAVRISTYWGQDATEGSLKELCTEGTVRYVKAPVQYVNIAFLRNIGGGRTPELSLRHCNSTTCPLLSSEIELCQSLGIQVLISLAGAPNLSSTAEAYEVASYIWDNFLGGSSSSRPLGEAVLNGVDYHIHSGKPDFLDDLARALSGYNTPENKQVYLAAGPECLLPDRWLDASIRTGLFDYVWVEFFDNPTCQYTPDNLIALFQSWNEWASYPGVNALFLGIPVSPEVAPDGGYIPYEVLVSVVLPFVETYVNFGGIMLWPYRHHHPHPHYSEKFRVQSYAAI